MATPEIIKDIKLDNSETDSDDMTTDDNIADNTGPVEVELDLFRSIYYLHSKKILTGIC